MSFNNSPRLEQVFPASPRLFASARFCTHLPPSVGQDPNIAQSLSLATPLSPSLGLEPPGARGAAQPSLRVVSSPWLLRLITSFQGGLSLLLYTLWTDHNPQQPRGHVDHNQIDQLLELIAEFGTPYHLGLLHKSHMYADRKRQTPQFDNVARLAVVHHLSDLLEWVIANNMLLIKPPVLWETAIANWESDDDLALLKLLQRHAPITRQRAQRLLTKTFRGAPTVVLFQWFRTTFPELVWPKTLAIAAVKHGELVVVQYLLEHAASRSIHPQVFAEAYRAAIPMCSST